MRGNKREQIFPDTDSYNNEHNEKKKRQFLRVKRGKHNQETFDIIASDIIGDPPQNHPEPPETIPITKKKDEDLTIVNNNEDLAPVGTQAKMEETKVELELDVERIEEKKGPKKLDLERALKRTEATCFASEWELVEYLKKQNKLDLKNATKRPKDKKAAVDLLKQQKKTKKAKILAGENVELNDVMQIYRDDFFSEQKAKKRNFVIKVVAGGVVGVVGLAFLVTSIISSKGSGSKTSSQPVKASIMKPSVEATPKTNLTVSANESIEKKQPTPVSNQVKASKEIKTAETTVIQPVEKRVKSSEIRKPVSIAKEEKAFSKTVKIGTMEAFKAFLKHYPNGRFYLEARWYLTELKKVENQQTVKEINREIIEKVGKRKKLSLRGFSLQLSSGQVEKTVKKSMPIKNRFEKRLIENQKVVIDYATGLMWHFWRCRTDFVNARIFSVRSYAGYSDWRLPSVEELSSIVHMDFSRYWKYSLCKMQFWTCDKGNGNSMWTLEIPTGKFEGSNTGKLRYVCSVRQIK